MLLGFSDPAYYILSSLQCFYLMVEFCSLVLYYFWHFYQSSVCVFFSITQAFVLLTFVLLDFTELFYVFSLNSLNSLMKLMIYLILHPGFHQDNIY